jgi:hypothetical protein
MTERGRYRFTIKERARGHFRIAAEPAGDTIKICRQGEPLAARMRMVH